jgi:EmrB/QacA subfamily drug resistance transporter
LRAGAPAPAPLSPGEFRLALAGLMTTLTLAALDQNIVGSALPRITSDLGGLAHLSWIVTAFMLASTATTPIYGKLSDIYGRRPLFVTAIVLFLLGSALCGTAGSMTQLILFRGVQGLGAGGLIALAQTALGDFVSPRERGRYQGLFTAVFALCSVSGPLLGGFLTDALSWRWIFYVNLPVGAAALVLILLGLPRRPGMMRHRVDYLGAAVLTATTTSALLVLTWGGSVYPWSSPIVIGLGLAALALLASFIALERHAPEALLPLRLFAGKVFVVAVAVTGLTSTALFGAMIFLPTYFQIVLGASPSQSGLLTTPLMGGLIVASTVGGRLVSRTGHYKRYPVAGLATATAVFLLMRWTIVSGAPNLVLEGQLVVLGACLGLVMPNMTVSIQNAVDRPDLGIATSSASFFRSLGGSLGVALSGAILTGIIERTRLPGSGDLHATIAGGIQRLASVPAETRTAVAALYRDAIAASFLAGAAVAALAFAIVLLLPERPLR